MKIDTTMITVNPKVNWHQLTLDFRYCFVNYGEKSHFAFFSEVCFCVLYIIFVIRLCTDTYVYMLTEWKCCVFRVNEEKRTV